MPSRNEAASQSKDGSIVRVGSFRVVLSSVALVLIFGSACSTTRIKGSRGLDAILTQPTPPEPAEAAQAVVTKPAVASSEPENSIVQVEAPEPAPEPASESVPELINETSDEAKAAIAEIPIDDHELVQKWIRYFTEKDRERFQRFLDRGAQYREVVENILEENGLPKELYFLAMIESGYRSEATSIARAAGVWQFIPGTGTRYGLQVNSYADERRDPIRATEAASKYLRDLYNVFGSWHLAMAAYNAGEYRIVGAVVRGKSRDFWRLAEKKVLPSETLNYVPKFLAAVMIGRDLEKYGFDLPNGERYPDLEAIEVPSPVRLSDIAAAAGISAAELQRVNPHLARGMTPPSSSTYEIWLPEQHAKNADRLHAVLASKRLRGVAKVAAIDSGRYHRVRSGETLAKVAGKYRVSVSYLKRLNGLSSSRVMQGQMLRVTAKSYHPKSRAERNIASKSKAKLVRYKVRRGDNLTAIARKFGVSVAELKKANSLRRNEVQVGQVLRVTPRI